MTNIKIDMKEPKSVLVKITGQCKLRITVMISVLADGNTFVITDTQDVPQDKPPNGMLVECNEKNYMTREFMVEWLREVWDRWPSALLKKTAMLISDAYKGYLGKSFQLVI